MGFKVNIKHLLAMCFLGKNVNVSVSLFEIINYLVLSRLHQLICKMLSVMPAYSRFSINVSFLLFYPPPNWGVYAFVSAKTCSL